MASNSGFPNSVWRPLQPMGFAGLGVLACALAGCSRPAASTVHSSDSTPAPRAAARAEAIPWSVAGASTDRATPCVALDETTPTDTGRLSIVTPSPEPGSTRKPVVAVVRPKGPTKPVSQAGAGVAAGRPTVRLANPTPVKEVPAPVNPVPVAREPVVDDAPVQQVVQTPPAPKNEPLSPPPALSIALSAGPTPAKTAAAPVLRVAKGRPSATPAPSAPEAGPVVVTPTAQAPLPTVAATAQPAITPPVPTAAVVMPPVGTQKTVELSEAGRETQEDSDVAAEAKVPAPMLR